MTKPSQIVSALLETDDFDPKDYVTRETPKKIDVLGLYYYPRHGGTPDHSVKVWVDDNLVYHSPTFCNGGQNQYLETAADWLEKNFYIPIRPHQRHGGKPPLWSWVRDTLGIPFSYSSEDVQRKRMLIR